MAEIVYTMHDRTGGVPCYEEQSFQKKKAPYCLLVPVINEGERITAELKRAQKAGISDFVDIVICDGGSDDGSMNIDSLRDVGVNALLTKRDFGRQSAQLRTGIAFACDRGYDGVLTIDGNNKDSIECVPLFVEALLEGYDLVQGSRFIECGEAINTPLSRLMALRLIHVPLISFRAKFHYTDTTNAFRAYSMKLLTDPRVAPLRDVFVGYELLAYLSIRAPQLGYKVCEVPVVRTYPTAGKTPTKISPVRGSIELMSVLLKAISGCYDPDETYYG